MRRQRPLHGHLVEGAKEVQRLGGGVGQNSHLRMVRGAWPPLWRRQTVAAAV